MRTTNQTLTRLFAGMLEVVPSTPWRGLFRSVVIMLLAFVWGTGAWAYSGTGTEGDPYVINGTNANTNWNDLKTVMGLGGYIRLDANCTDGTKSSDSYLNVPSSTTVVLNLNGKTINRNLTTAIEYGYVIYNRGTLTINGKFSKPRLYNSDGTELVNNDNNVTSVTADLIANNVYYFYCEPYERAFLSSFSYTFQAYIAKSYDVVPSTQSSYEITAVEGLGNPTYTILATAGEITMSDVYMSGNTINGFSGKPGAVKVRISEGGTDFYFILTVAYPATPYPGKLWDFNIDDGDKASLEVHAYYWSEGKGFPRIDARATPAITFEGREGENATGWSVTDNNGGTWIVENDGSDEWDDEDETPLDGKLH